MMDFLELQAEIENLTSEITKRDAEIRSMVTNIHGHLKWFHERLKRSDEQCLAVMRAYEEDVPPFVVQAQESGWEAGQYVLPYTMGKIWFNPSLCELDGQKWLISRESDINPHKRPPFNTFSRIVRIPLSSDHRCGKPIDIPLPKGPTKNEQWEDPRIQNIGHKLWLTCTNFIQGKSFAHQAMWVLDTRFALEGVNHPVIGKNGDNIHANQGHEKNWIWFFHDGLPHCLYWAHPHTVYQCDLVCQPQVEHKTNAWNRLWKHGEPRGGANPVLVDGEYWTFFHSSMPWWNQRRRYFMGAYAFEAQPPFQITRATSLPLLTGSLQDDRILEFPLVIFPGGAIFDRSAGEWHVVFGVNDCRCGWVKIPHADLEALTRKAT